MAEIKSHLYRGTLLLLSVGLFIACGSIRGRTQHVSVDSTPRGVTVYDRDGNRLGETPIFHKVKRRSEVVLDLDEDGVSAQQKVKCEFMGVRTSLENLPLPLVFLAAGGLIALGVYGAGILTDTLTGAAYQCPERISLKSAKGVIKTKQSCPRFLIAGLTDLSHQTRREITERWWTKHSANHVNQSAKSQCDLTAIQDEEAWSHRLDLGIDEFDTKSLEDWREETDRVNRFGYETGASHLLHLSYQSSKSAHSSQSDSYTQVKVTEVDLHTLKSFESVIASPPALIKESQSVSHNVRALLSFGRSFIPDTLGLSTMIRSYRGLSRRRETFDNDQSSQTVAFTHVSHPNAFNAWDYDFNLSFGVGFDPYQEFSLNDEDLTKVTFNRYAASALLNATGHTPLGAIGVTLGPNLSVYQLTDPRVEGYMHIAREWSTGLHYTFFLTEKVMGRLRMGTTHIFGSIGDHILPQFTEVAFMLGYYFPTLQKLPNQLIDESEEE